MLSNPIQGQAVQCWYRNRAMPLHGLVGTVEIVSRGRPRNHGVRIGGRMYVIPAGNLRKEKP